MQSIIEASRTGPHGPQIVGLKLCTTGFNRMISSFGIVLFHVDIVVKTPNAEDPASHKSGLYGAAFYTVRIE